jgi:hypothetical protein
MENIITSSVVHTVRYENSNENLEVNANYQANSVTFTSSDEHGTTVTTMTTSEFKNFRDLLNTIPLSNKG